MAAAFGARPLASRLLDEGTVDRPPLGPVEREVDAHVHAAVAEVPVAQSVQAVLGHERGEVTQVRA